MHYYYYYYYYYYTCLVPRTSWLVQYQNDKPFWVLMQKEMMKVVVVTAATLIHMQIISPPLAYQLCEKQTQK